MQGVRRSKHLSARAAAQSVQGVCGVNDVAICILRWFVTNMLLRGVHFL